MNIVYQVRAGVWLFIVSNIYVALKSGLKQLNSIGAASAQELHRHQKKYGFDYFGNVF